MPPNVILKATSFIFTFWKVPILKHVTENVSMRSTWHRYFNTFMIKSPQADRVLCYCAFSEQQPCVAATCHLSGHIVVTWNKLWLRTLQESPQHSDMHWCIASASSSFPPPHKANTIKGRMLPHIAWSLSAKFHQQICTTTSPQWVQRSVFFLGLGCSDGAKHSSVLGNVLNNADWKLSGVYSIFHKACSVNCAAVWVQSAMWQRLVEISMDASPKGGRSINLDP